MDIQNKFDKRILKIVIYILLVVFAIALINFIIQIPNEIAAQNNDWIGFYGGLLGSSIGGFVTYLGVRETIKHNQESNLLDSRKGIMPFINVEIDINNEDLHIHTVESDIIRNKELIHDVFNDEYFYLNYKIKNIGRDSSCNIYSAVEIIRFKESNHNEVDSKKCQYVHYNTASLVKGENSNTKILAIKPNHDNYVLIQTYFDDIEGRSYMQIAQIDISIINNYSINNSSFKITSGVPTLKVHYPDL